ncbi:MAG: nucleotide exchange factor GrpE [Candidatus Micrarchaeia archaeon]
MEEAKKEGGNENNEERAAKQQGQRKQEEQQQPQQAKQQPQQQSGAQSPEATPEAAELKDRLLRLAAEFDNYKKRVASEAQASKTVGKAELISKLLPAIDAFEIALYSLGDEHKELCKGFELVFSDLYEALKSEGLEEIGTSGKFDPYKQEVVLTRPSDKEEGSVVEVVRKGYLFNGILIRPASVIVSSGKKS